MAQIVKNAGDLYSLYGHYVVSGASHPKSRLRPSIIGMVKQVDNNLKGRLVLVGPLQRTISFSVSEHWAT